LELAVLLLPAGHADEQPLAALDDLDVVDHEAMVEDDRYEGFELLLLDRKDLDLCDLHCASLSVVPVGSACGGTAHGMCDRWRCLSAPPARSGFYRSDDGRRTRTALLPERAALFTRQLFRGVYTQRGSRERRKRDFLDDLLRSTSRLRRGGPYAKRAGPRLSNRGRG